MRPFIPYGTFDQASSSQPSSALGASPSRRQLSLNLEEEDEDDGALESEPVLDPALPSRPGMLASAPEYAQEAHRAALVCICEGKDTQAEALLELVVMAWPSYLAAQMELAGVLARRAAWPEVVERLHEVLLLATDLPDEALIEGPEPLPLAFYVAASHALLNHATKPS